MTAWGLLYVGLYKGKKNALNTAAPPMKVDQATVKGGIEQVLTGNLCYIATIIFLLWFVCGIFLNVCFNFLRTTRSKLRDRERNSTASPPPSSSPKAGPSDSQHLEDYNSSSCGYNSGDEYSFCETQDLTEAEWLEVCAFTFLVIPFVENLSYC